jgi:hypothetical protein
MANTLNEAAHALALTVYSSLSAEAKSRTSFENVRDVVCTMFTSGMAISREPTVSDVDG